MKMGPWEFAVIEGGEVQEVLPTAAEAVDAAGLPRDNPYYDITPFSLMGMDELVDLKQTPSSGRAAFNASGLGQVSGLEVMQLTDGLRDPTEAFERLYPYFKHLEGSNWKSPEKMMRSFLGGNEKVNEPRAGVKGNIKGLTLVPYWRNLQDEAVFRARSNAATMKEFEENFDVDPRNADGTSAIPYEFNWCIGSSWACRRACLIGTGNNYQPMSFKTKFAKATALKADPVAFCAMLALNVSQFHGAQRKAGKQAFVRLNMLSDIPWEIVFPDLFTMHPKVQFYDYTKVDVAKRNIPRNYDLTYSFNGTNEAGCKAALRAGHRIATVFVSADASLSPYKKPQRVSFEEAVDHFGGVLNNPFGANMDVALVNGNENDFRPIDPAPSVVFLSYKGPKGVPEAEERKIRTESGFAVQVVPVRRIEMGDLSVMLTSSDPYESPFSPREIDDTEEG